VEEADVGSEVPKSLKGAYEAIYTQNIRVKGIKKLAAG
jgi:hypothetical protein